MQKIKRFLAFALSLLLVITAIRFDFNAAKADEPGGGEQQEDVSGNTVHLSVGFRNTEYTEGEVQYSTDGGDHWEHVNNNINNQDVVVSNPNLYIRIVPQQNKEADVTGTVLRINETDYPAQTQDPNDSERNINTEVGNDLIGNNGRAIEVEDGMNISLSNVEFRDAPENNNDQGNQGQQGGDDNIVHNPNGMRLKVSFRNNEEHPYNSSWGKVQYSLDGKQTWIDVTTNIDTDVTLNANVNDLHIRIVAAEGYHIDFAGTEYKQNQDRYGLGNSANPTISGALSGDNGYQVSKANVDLVELNNVEFAEGADPGPNGGGEDHHDYNSSATITMSSSDATWTGPAAVWEENVPRDDNDNVIWNYRTQASWSKAGISINGSWRQYFHDEDDRGNRTPVENGTLAFEYDSEEADETVDMEFFFNWGYRPANNTVTINGTVYQTYDFGNEAAWLEGFSFVYRNQDISFKVTVPKAETYSIVLDLRPITWDECPIGNFLWWDDANGNAELTLISATYPTDSTRSARLNGTSFNQDVLDRESLYESKDDKTARYITYGHDDGDGVGEMVLPYGTKVTMRVAPTFGHQVTAFTVNGEPIEPDDVDTGSDVAVFTFNIGKGNFHLRAIVEEVGNESVTANTQVVADAGIELGGSESSMRIGTAKLEIEDVDLLPEQISRFEEAAPGYGVSDYVDISLFNTVYKGTSAASWDTPVKTLDNEATIYLALEEDVSDKDIVVLHELADGSVETIEATYLAESDVVAFGTTSFSNYAIAYRDKTGSSSGSESASDSSDSSSAGNSSTSNSSTGSTVGTVTSSVTETKVTGEDGSSLNLTVHQSVQGPKAMAVINNTIPEGWKLQDTYNLMDGISTYSDPKTGKLVLTIPESLQKTGRSFAIILLANGGKPYLLTDEDKEAGKLTVTLKDNNGYAFALIYGDGYAANTSYVIQKGDSLSKVAKKFGTTVQFLVKKNGIANPNLIRIGQKLTVK